MELTTNSLKTTNYTSLSIQVRLDGLSFFTQNPSSKEVGVYDVVSFRKNVNPTNLVHLIENAFQNHPALTKDFSKVTVIYDNELYAVVPLPLFNKNNISDYLKFSTKILSTDFIAFDELTEQQKVVVYVPYTNVTNYFFDRYGSFDYYHSTTLFLKRLSQQQSLGGARVFTHIKEGYFDLAVLKDQKLALINTYRITSKEDFLYYLLFAYEQLGLDPNEVPLSFLGAVDQENILYKKAYTFIRNCVIDTHPSSIIQKEDTLLASLL